MNKFIDSMIYIKSFEQKCVIIKVWMTETTYGHNWSRPIVISNSTVYEHICLENIKKIYKPDGKYYDQQKYQAIIEVSNVSTPEGLTENNPLVPGPYVTVKNPNARKSLHQFLKILMSNRKLLSAA